LVARQPGTGLQRNTVTLALSLGSFVLAAGGVALSFFMYWNSLQALQRAETDVQRETVGKVANETKTTAAEAKYADRLNALAAQNEALRTELIQAQSAQARAEKVRAEAETKLADVDSELKAISLQVTRQTTGDPEFQKALGGVFRNVLTPTLDCVKARPDESKDEFQQRCKGRGLGSSFMQSSDGTSVTGIPIGLTGGARSPRPPVKPEELRLPTPPREPDLGVRIPRPPRN
jgi:hypothetical protein